MKLLANVVDKIPKSIILATILGLLSFSCLNLYILKNQSDSMIELEEYIKQSTDSEKENVLNMIMQMGYETIGQNTDLSSKKLENKLLREYDLQKLKVEFDKSILSEELYEIIKDSLTIKKGNNVLTSNNQMTMVANKDGIIAAFNNNSGVGSGLEYTDKILPWEEFISNSSNPELMRNALKKVLNERNGIAFIEMNTNSGIKTPNIDDIIQLYIKNGISSLKNYYFLTASYITDDGDIFGISDQTYLTTNENYKLIIIKMVSIEDMMHLFEKEIFKIDQYGNITSTKLEWCNDLMVISSVISSIFLFTIALLLACIYNKGICEKE